MCTLMNLFLDARRALLPVLLASVIMKSSTASRTHPGDAMTIALSDGVE